MTPLNFTIRAAEQLRDLAKRSSPGSRAGFLYLADKLIEAQVFVLGDGGELLDRSKARPQVPGIMFRPPFPVVACEYVMEPTDYQDEYNATACPKRIALAWEWQNDLPPALASINGHLPLEGVCIVSIPYYAEHQAWLPIMAGMLLSYEQAWMSGPTPLPYREAMVASGRIKRARADDPAIAALPVILNPDAMSAMIREGNSYQRFLDICSADTMDEINAFADLCLALACKNVTTRDHAAPEKLNRQREKAGKLPLKGFHVLELMGGASLPGQGMAGDRNGPRSHLRRGHIRRISDNRVTWVNSTVVRGRGLVEKVYSVGALRGSGAHA